MSTTTYKAEVVRKAFYDSLKSTLATYIKTFVSGWLNAADKDKHVLPVLSLATSNLRRAGGSMANPIWEMDVILHVLNKQGNVDIDDALLRLMAETTTAIDIWESASNSGSVSAGPMWDTWYAPGEGELTPIGAIGSLTLKFEGKLKVTV